MKFLKRLNLLDYVIIIVFISTVTLGIYNFFPGRVGECRMTITLFETADIKNGDACYDIAGRRNLGSIKINNDSIYVSFKGSKGDNGIEIGERIYAINMPLELYVGDYYLEGEVASISCDMGEN